MIAQFKQRISEINRVQPLNPVMMELLQAIQDSNSEADDLKRIIDSDANTSATILKIANSPFYGLSGKIRNVRDACVLLGFDQLRNIIYATALHHATSNGPHPKWRLALSQHALASAVVSHTLAQLPEIPVDPGLAYSLGLLHELGKQILICEMPDIFEAFMELADADSAAEYEPLFAEAGVIIANKWRLPDSFRESIAHCHTRTDQHGEFLEDIKLVRCAHSVAQACGFPTPGNCSEATPSETLSKYYPDLDIDKVVQHIQEKLSENQDLTRESQHD
ncbi:MAG: hypothetical protein CMK83_03450 [Pseudomonadales bacterium]|uniref:HDOD domain-containing protein n=1 Tax=unclassified Ketobacter TaxID=2639109 RepID=UPI000C40603F|nr:MULTISPECIES: HDOD domain-containing protein [unclassified Ketobacter]MAQ23252.1 hypothetical protein [Pseudomonadales bacterium]MEC8812428.1 HDOD domain-containing protein [Pseudomonadota bacterium]HAG97095.1 hypothetical protein [Gammaproteobacteria bacterium]MBI27664.1 hypothetical protein [Pseudomonadales bacterium]RLT90693.1 MAG: HDOD domain-containing protein [Ketobacter sp. GenoA1]|tara:strand:+ start:12337 stop:13170 length:834 start_codon:yes stop_codon:yes gene_type:complete